MDSVHELHRELTGHRGLNYLWVVYVSKNWGIQYGWTGVSRGQYRSVSEFLKCKGEINYN